MAATVKFFSPHKVSFRWISEKFILWFSGLQLYGVAQRDTVHLSLVPIFFLIYPLLSGVALSDSVYMEHYYM